jgi:uncharacterized membrane protein YidH (DUF202 family)
MTETLREAADSKPMDGLARWGLTARAVIYLLIGVLALEVATGRSNRETDQRGALNDLSTRPGGKAVLILLAIGFAGYALWRFSDAVFGVRGEPGRGPRFKSGFRGLVYACFAVVTILVLTNTGAQKSQAGQQEDLSARVMHHTGGRLVVGAVGVVVVLVGLSMVIEGVTRRFQRHLRTEEMYPQTRKMVMLIGTIGSVARGVVFGLAGVLVINAAVTFNPAKARGIDGALRTLARQPYGTALLVAAAVGLVIFGLYGLAESRWQRT